MAGATIRLGRYRIAPARRAADGERRNSSRGRKHRLGTFRVPYIGAVCPRSVLQPLDQTRFDAPSVRELFPYFRAARKIPGIGPGGVDKGAGRDMKPAPLRGSVRPQWILR